MKNQVRFPPEMKHQVSKQQKSDISSMMSRTEKLIGHPSTGGKERMGKAFAPTLAFLALVLSASAQDKPVKPCVIVRTGKGSMRIDAGGECHGTRSCFLYIDSMNVPTSDIKDQYKAKDIQKLEKKGTKVVVEPSVETVDLQAAKDSCQK